MNEMMIYDKNRILEDPVLLQQYLEDIYTLESEYYGLSVTRERLEYEINELGQRRVGEGVDSYYENIIGGFVRSLSNVVIFAVGSIGIAVFIFVILEFFMRINLELVGMMIKLFLIVAVIVLARVIFKFLGAMKEEKENLEIRKKEKIYEVESDEKRIQNELQLIPKYKGTLYECEQNIEQCGQILHNLYEMDIIFPKYRNFVAVSQMFEYLISGRCTKLEGNMGAYSMYEQELRMDTISSKLVDILDEMEKIRNNQYMIYDAINQVNQRLGDVLDYEAVVAYNMQAIANNTEIYARYYIF